MSKFVAAKQLAETLDLTIRRVNQIAKENNIFIKDLNGKFDLVKSVSNYYHQKYASDVDKLNLDHEKTLHERVKRQKAEINLAKIKGEMHEAVDVERIMTDMLITFRNKVLAIPSKIAPTLIGLRNISKISEIIDNHLREALEELSEYDPAMFIGDTLEGDGDEEENNTTV